MFSLFKKKKVPNTLPDLNLKSVPTQQAPKKIEESVKSLNQLIAEAKEKHEQEDSAKETYQPRPLKTPFTIEEKEPEKLIKNIVKTDNETGFFKDLLNDLTKEMRDINKLDAWYKENLQQEDTINQMREYWEKQKPELLIRAVGGEMMAKLKEKTDRLHSLEKEWQDVYFELISKEEEIRTEEKELKKELSEFIELCKKKLKQKNK